MLPWLESLTFLEQIMLYLAVPATVLLLLQTTLLLMGLGGGHDVTGDSPESGALLDLDSGHDVTLDLDGDGIPDAHGGLPCDACGETHAGELHDGDAHPHPGDSASASLPILTLRGFVAFFSLFGWSGLLFCQVGFHWLLSLFLAVQIGVIGMVGVAFILREALRLQSDGTLDIRNAVGRSGTVYLTVPAEGVGFGKVNVVVQEQMRELEAVTDENIPIPTGSDIVVVGIVNGDTLVVRNLADTSVQEA